MSKYSDEFFAEKRPWSRIKDRVLGAYMSPYIAKVSKLGRPFLLIDAFAGPGIFDDGRPGSPFLICQAAERYASGKYQAMFVNSDFDHHNRLTSNLEAAGWSSAIPILGDSQTFLREVADILTSQSVFLYIDPFGLSAFDFETLRPFLQRKPFSTEIVVNLCTPALHRLAMRDSIASGEADSEMVERNHGILTRALGGDYWKETLLGMPQLEAKAREMMIVDQFCEKLMSTDYLRYTGACPIQATKDSRTKYYMIFASPHVDAMLLFNDEMCKAFNELTNDQEMKDTLFADQPWTIWQNEGELFRLVVGYVSRYAGATRQAIWIKVVEENFMRFTKSAYLQAVNHLIDNGRIACSTPYPSSIRQTKRLNDNCTLIPI